MNHPAELALHQYMENAASGKSTMSVETIQQIGQDVKCALARQFGGGTSVMGLVFACQMWVDQPVNFGLRRTSQRKRCLFPPHLL